MHLILLSPAIVGEGSARRIGGSTPCGSGKPLMPATPERGAPAERPLASRLVLSTARTVEERSNPSAWPVWNASRQRRQPHRKPSKSDDRGHEHRRAREHLPQRTERL